MIQNPTGMNEISTIGDNTIQYSTIFPI